MSQDPLFSVDGRVVVVTGAGGLIGSTLADALHERGACLALVDTVEDKLDRVTARYAERCIAAGTDVSDGEAVARLVQIVLEAYGRVDALVNAHQFKPEGFLEALPEHFDEALWDDILRVNLKGTFLTCREFGRQMIVQQGGTIVNLASTYGVVSSNPALYADNSMGNPLAYTASKGGVIALTKYLAAYWGEHNVRVNCVTPHGVYNQQEERFVERFSSMSPLQRMSEVEEVVGAIIYLIADASSYTTGANLLVEGGWTAW